MKYNYLKYQRDMRPKEDFLSFQNYLEYHEWQALICEGRFTRINQQAGSRMKHSFFKKGGQRQIMGQVSWTVAQGCHL